MLGNLAGEQSKGPLCFYSPQDVISPFVLLNSMTRIPIGLDAEGR